jgi:hypothetical protein
LYTSMISRREKTHTQRRRPKAEELSLSLSIQSFFGFYNILTHPQYPPRPSSRPSERSLSLSAINRCLNSLLPKNSQSSTVMVIERFPTASHTHTHTKLNEKFKISGLTVRRSVDFIIVLRIGIGTTGS